MSKATVTNRVMVCRFYSARGARSEVIELRPQGCDVSLPPSDGNDCWLVFLPPHGFDATGPFYLWREFLESDIALSPARSIHIEYKDSDLIPELWPHTEEEATVAQTAINENVETARAHMVRAQIERMDWPDRLPG